MNELSKAIILIGIMLIVLGLALSLGAKLPWIGKLPGDIFIKRDGFSFYFPLATSIIISIILAIIINLFTRK